MDFPSITDHCIIEEQGEHIVIALRVSKSEIASNIHLLAALANVVPPVHIAERGPPMSMAAKLLIAGIMLAAGMFGLPRIAPTESFASTPPPVEYRAWKMAKETFKSGEDINVGLIFSRDRICQTEVDRTIVRVSDQAVVYSSRVFGGISAATHGEFKEFHIVLHVPEPLPPGKYFYTGMTHSTCANDGSYDAPHGKLAFSVVE